MCVSSAAMLFVEFKPGMAPPVCPHVAGLDDFCVAVRRAAADAVFAEAQQAAHQQLYWKPLEQLASSMGFK